MKLCINCLYHHITPNGLHKCRANIQEVISPVTGETEEIGEEWCSSNRSTYGPCGAEARWFTLKPRIPGVNK